MRTKKVKKPSPRYTVINSSELPAWDTFNSSEDAKKAAMAASEEYDDDFTILQIQIIGEAVYEPPEVPVNNVRYISHI